MSREFRELYRSPEGSYASMDFIGRGYITKEDLIKSLVVSKHLNKTFTEDDLNMFLAFYNLFPLKGGHRQQSTVSGKEAQRGVMIYDTFKKIFFAHLHLSFNIA